VVLQEGGTILFRFFLLIITLGVPLTFRCPSFFCSSSDRMFIAPLVFFFGSPFLRSGVGGLLGGAVFLWFFVLGFFFLVPGVCGCYRFFFFSVFSLLSVSSCLLLFKPPVFFLFPLLSVYEYSGPLCCRFSSVGDILFSLFPPFPFLPRAVFFPVKPLLHRFIYPFLSLSSLDSFLSALGTFSCVFTQDCL